MRQAHICRQRTQSQPPTPSLILALALAQAQAQIQPPSIRDPTVHLLSRLLAPRMPTLSCNCTSNRATYNPLHLRLLGLQALRIRTCAIPAQTLNAIRQLGFGHIHSASGSWRLFPSPQSYDPNASTPSPYLRYPRSTFDLPLPDHRARQRSILLLDKRDPIASLHPRHGLATAQRTSRGGRHSHGRP